MTPSHCVLCNHPMRPGQVTIAEAPGTRSHRAMGLCRVCYYEERGAGRIPEPDGKRGRKKGDVSGVSYNFDEARARRALDWWLADRRRRLEKQGAMA